MGHRWLRRTRGSPAAVFQGCSRWAAPPVAVTPGVFASNHAARLFARVDHVSDDVPVDHATAFELEVKDRAGKGRSTWRFAPQMPFLKASLLVPLLVLLLSISVNADTPTPRGTSDGPPDAAVAAVANAAAAALPAAPALAATAFTWEQDDSVLMADTVDLSGAQTWSALPGSLVPGGNAVRFLHSAGTTLVVLNDLHDFAPLLPPRNSNFRRVKNDAKQAGLMLIMLGWEEAFGREAGQTSKAIVCEIELISQVLLFHSLLKRWTVGKRRGWTRWVHKIKSATPEELSAAVTSAAAAVPAPQASQRRRQQPTARRQPSGVKLKRQDRKVTLNDPEVDKMIDELKESGNEETARALGKLRPGVLRSIAVKFVKQRRDGKASGFKQCLDQMLQTSTANAETQILLQDLCAPSKNAQDRTNNMATREPATYQEYTTTGGETKRRRVLAKKKLVVKDGDVTLHEADMPDVFAKIEEKDLHAHLYGELRCPEEWDCGLAAEKPGVAWLDEAETEACAVTAAPVSCFHWRNQTSDALFGGVSRVFNPIRQMTGRLVYGKSAPQEIVSERKPESNGSVAGANRHRFHITDVGLLYGDLGRFYVGVERWLLINSRATACRIWSLRTHALDLILSLRRFFIDKTGDIELKLECSPWMDGTTMCKAAACMGQYTFRLLEVAGKKVEEVVTVGKTEMDILTRPRPAFFAWCKETRNFGEMLATIMGVQLRQACTENGFVITIQGQRIKFSVVGGKLRGDFHAIQQFLGLYMSGKRTCPFLQVDASYGDFHTWMTELKKNGSSLTMQDYLNIAKRLEGDDAAETFKQQIREAEVHSKAPIFAGDHTTPVEERGLDPGPIMGDPEHVISALIKNVFFEFEEHMSESAKTELGKLVEKHVRRNTSYKDHMDGRDWRKLLVNFEKIVLPAMRKDSNSALNEAETLFKCLRIIYICVSAEPEDITSEMELLFRAATFCWGSVLEHLQSIGFFTERVFNLYYIYVRVFLPYLFCKKNAPKLVSTQYNEALWGPIRRMLERRSRKANRQSLLDIARFLASRIKGMPEYGTADDIRVREGASIISKAEKALEKETEQVEWRECDFVIPAWVMKLPKVQENSKLFEELMLGGSAGKYAGMHERNEDKSWTFRTANSEGTVNPVPLPQSLTVQYTVKRTMRLVIQAPPEGSAASVRGCANKVLTEESSGKVQQEGAVAAVAMRDVTRTKSKRLSKAECLAICGKYRRNRGEAETGLRSKNLGGESGLQVELWNEVRAHGELSQADLADALDGLVPDGYTLMAADDGAVRVATEANAAEDREEEEAAAEREAAARLVAEEEAAAAEAAEVMMGPGLGGAEEGGGVDGFDVAPALGLVAQVGDAPVPGTQADAGPSDMETSPLPPVPNMGDLEELSGAL